MYVNLNVLRCQSFLTFSSPVLISYNVGTATLYIKKFYVLPTQCIYVWI